MSCKALSSMLRPVHYLQPPSAGSWVTPGVFLAHVPTQDDTCLAELALALSISLEISSKQRLVGVTLGVRTLQAELHEGLFCSPLLHRVTARAPQPSPGQGQEQGWQSPHFHCSQRDLAVLSLLPSAGSGSLGESLSVTWCFLLQTQQSP